MPGELHLFYDGSCGLCHGGVKFILKRDRAARFLFAPLESPACARLLPPGEREALPDSVVVMDESGRLLVRGPAVIAALRALGGGWKLLGGLLAFVPGPLMNWGYDRVAKVRKKLFAKPPGPCPLMPPELRGRFLWD